MEKIRLIFFIVSMLLVIPSVNGNIHPYEEEQVEKPNDLEICGIRNGRKLYIDLSESGSVQATNIIGNISQTSPTLCRLELVTCPSCVISLKFRHINIPTCSQDTSCRCDYVWVTEPPYETSGKSFCGVYNNSTVTYTSQTKTINIAFSYSSNHQEAFALDYHAERNRQKFEVNNERNSSFNGGVINTPFFPELYPRDFSVEYIITSPDKSAIIQIVFSDFILAGSSILEFYDWNGIRIDASTGDIYRPNAIRSTGPSLVIRFYANGGTSIGYRATFSFIKEINDNTQLNTDCGGIVDNGGGTITMMNMIDEKEGIKTYDCVWIIKPPKNYFHLKTHLYIKVGQFSDFGGTTELTIVQGTTSQGVVLDSFRSPVTEILASSRSNRELILPLSVGFYVSLRGVFTHKSKLAIIYSAFSYMDCFASSDYLCKNHRCILSKLSCDGFDHCGDSSDEPYASCYKDWEDFNNEDLYNSRPNYYFPKMDRYPDLKTATVVFLGSSFGLVLLIVALIILLYRMGSRNQRNNPQDYQSRLLTISELLDGTIPPDLPIDDPPTYEAPPDYDQVVKIFGTHIPPITQQPSAQPLPSTSSSASTSNSLPENVRRKIKSLRPQLGKYKLAGTSGETGFRVRLPLEDDSPRPSMCGALLLSRALPAIVTEIPDSPPPPYHSAIEPNIRLTIENEITPSTSSSSGNYVNNGPNSNNNLCKLASIETFDDLSRSFESIATTTYYGPSSSTASTHFLSNEINNEKSKSCNDISNEIEQPCNNYIPTTSHSMSQVTDCTKEFCFQLQIKLLRAQILQQQNMIPKLKRFNSYSDSDSQSD